ncbi:inositol monophosphatase family protein [Allofournierella sp.]|uniref:inositol monophosphatase family protein n=1 Tax=Allofournierella sp. TaxID=1940256 RepID=UPI003AB192AF
MDRFELAQKLILQAGAALRQSHLESGAVWQKTGHQDLVTRWDKETEQFLRQGLLSACPGDTIVGEEYPPALHSTRGAVWYLDPIDGTTNFVNQHSNYAVSIGCYQNGAPLFGLVLDVERQLLYTGRSGGGAFCNNEPIHVAPHTRIPELLLYTPDVLRTFLAQHPARGGLVRLAEAVRCVRSLGSVALELCAVAAGQADLFVTLCSSPWDHNAARIILAEAGGCICDLSGKPFSADAHSTVLAANSAQVLARALNEYIL